MGLAAGAGLVCREAFHNAEHPANRHVARLLQVGMGRLPFGGGGCCLGGRH
jgi:hypothetical protein